jgi:hypothetical protein
MPGTILIQGSVEVGISPSSLFKFVSDLSNDSNWRNEIRQTILHGTPALGATATEESYLSKKLPRHILELHCTQWKADDLAVWETATGAPYFLQSIRKVHALSDRRSVFEYRIVFDKAIVYQALGIKLPGFLIRLGARRDLKAYLVNLKNHLEK